MASKLTWARGLWHAFVHRGFPVQARRKRMVCRGSARHSPCDVSGRRAGSGVNEGILFLLAGQLIAVQKACQSPHAPARCHPGFPHRCATGPRLYGPRFSRAETARLHLFSKRSSAVSYPIRDSSMFVAVHRWRCPGVRRGLGSHLAAARTVTSTARRVALVRSTAVSSKR